MTNTVSTLSRQTKPFDASSQNDGKIFNPRRSAHKEKPNNKLLQK